MVVTYNQPIVGYVVIVKKNLLKVKLRMNITTKLAHLGLENATPTFVVNVLYKAIQVLNSPYFDKTFIEELIELKGDDQMTYNELLIRWIFHCNHNRIAINYDCLEPHHYCLDCGKRVEL